MQHIGLRIINEDNETIEESNINFAYVVDTLWKIQGSKENYPFLVGIDSYGYTYFNLYQSSKVIEELEKRMVTAFTDVVNLSVEKKICTRQAAHHIALERVAMAAILRGF